MDVSNYFRVRGLLEEAELLEKCPNTVTGIVDRLRELDDDDLECFQCENGLDRKVVHLTAEALGFLSNTAREAEYDRLSCDGCCKICRIDAYKRGKKYVVVGKDITISRRNRSTKRRLYYERKARCQGRDKRRITLRPKLDIL